MINLQPLRTALEDKVDAAERLVDATAGGPASREARGLVFVLLHASYESLLFQLTKTLLETTLTLGVGNRRLQPGLRALALANAAKSTRDLGQRKLYSQALPRLIDTADLSRECTIDPTVFPDDGSFMRTSQVELWCRLFAMPHPGSLLREIWNTLDSVVSERNAVAHGEKTPEEVGRSYTETEVRTLISDWRNDWLSFLNAVELAGQSRDFYRRPR